MKDQKDLDPKLSSPIEKDETVRPMNLEGHRPKTRREFLAQGFLGMSAMALAPSVLDMVVGRAHGATNCTQSGSGLTPVIIIDLAGGGNLAGSNVMVGGQGGQMDFLGSYQTLGLPPRFHPSAFGVDTEMGLAFHNDSGILRGIRRTAPQAVRQKVEGTIFCSISDDDTGNNQHNPIYWLNKAGAKGQLNQLAGTQQSLSGGNSQAPASSINPIVAPVRIENDSEAMNLAYLGETMNNFSQSKVQSIIRSMAMTSERKIASISRRSLPQQIKQILGCSFAQTSEQVSKFNAQSLTSARDPRVITAMADIQNATIRARVAPITKLVLDGVVGVGTIVLGGYDYHDGSRGTGEIRDQELGEVMGAIMHLASLKGKDVVVYVISDGSVAANETIDDSAEGRGKYAWSGDSGNRGATVMMVYRHSGKPSLRSNRQVGYFRENGNVEANAMLTSNSVINTAKAMVANYLALHGREGQLENVIGHNPFVNQGLDKYLVFNRIR